MRTKVMTVMRRHAHDEARQDESEHNEADGTKKGADSTGEVIQITVELKLVTG